MRRRAVVLGVMCAVEVQTNASDFYKTLLSSRRTPPTFPYVFEERKGKIVPHFSHQGRV